MMAIAREEERQCDGDEDCLAELRGEDGDDSSDEDVQISDYA